jgi:hypothetical protein
VGQPLIKDALLFSAALVIGGTVQDETPTAERGG